MSSKSHIRYLEIVTPDVDGTIAALEASGPLKFSEPIAELGHARLADMPSGGQMGIRAPCMTQKRP